MLTRHMLDEVAVEGWISSSRGFVFVPYREENQSEPGRVFPANVIKRHIDLRWTTDGCCWPEVHGFKIKLRRLSSRSNKQVESCLMQRMNVRLVRHGCKRLPRTHTSGWREIILWLEFDCESPQSWSAPVIWAAVYMEQTVHALINITP